MHLQQANTLDGTEGLMLLCGEMIDFYMGAFLGLSTLAAAGLGNMISCASGVLTGGFIERLVYRLGLPSAKLTPLQADSRVVKNAHLSGSMLGICIGCLIGMFPLLLLKNGSKEKEAPSENTQVVKPLEE
ncbi:putative transmembrane protein 65 [Cardiosporidium cionae]|uniref:Transmembrane protein 65 n=1 Tax=Cardiosporidium cionae TaxID=476202 RepID=A0ABQ7J4N0_9APIC|nr:putative transmembrane protein 65 [Cardiosporidium cionae]|eukprot:KAF8818139.1 putative transmembrane protein 65 [Cardiosporidium cionae]